jgi:regulatory Fis family protein
VAAAISLAGQCARTEPPDGAGDALLHRGTSVDEAALERLCLPRGQPTVHAVVESARDEQEPEDEPAKIRQALRRTEGNVAQAARLLGWSRKALRYRIDRYGIERPSREVAIPLFRRRPDSTAPRPLLPNKGQAEEAAEPQGVNMKRSDQAIPQVEGPS